MPTSAMAATADGFTSVARARSARQGQRPVAGEVVEPAERHLRPPGVVDAQEQDGGDVAGVGVGHRVSFSCVLPGSEIGVGNDEVRGTRATSG